MNTSTKSLLTFFLLSLPASACSRNFALVSNNFRLATWLLLALLLLRKRRGLALLPVMALAMLWAHLGLSFLVWFPIMMSGIASLAGPWFKEQTTSFKRKSAVSASGLTLLVFLVLGPTPIFFRQGCLAFSCKMEQIVPEIESYQIEHGEWPSDLNGFSQQSCLPYETSAFGAWLYRAQGIEFLPYGYAVEGDSFRLWCRTGSHAQSGAAKGFPQYTPATGRIERP